MPEDRPTISSSRVAAADIARHSFGTVRRGFDPQEVRAYLELVARELQGWEQHEQELRRDLADAEERSRNPVIDESTLTAALGQQSAAVLRNAHDEAARITLHVEETAASLVREAQQHASEALVKAESGAAERIAEAEIAASGIHQQTRQEAAALLDASRAEGEALVERAREQGRAMVEQAQEARRRVLADMAQRRRAITLQIEQFRAARDELAAAVLGVRDSVDRVVGDLVRADDDARVAAADVARRQPAGTSEGALAAEVQRAVVDLEASAGGIFDVEDLTPVVERSPQAHPSAEADPSAEPHLPTEPSSAPVAVPDVQEAGEVSVVTLPAPLTGDIGAVDDPIEVDAVEDLFARLRASHPGERLGEEGASPAGEADVEEPTSAEPDGEEPEAEEGAPSTDETVMDEAGTEEDEGGGPDQPSLDRRGELLDPVVAKLARRLKRALQDDQNRLLDQLRSGSGEWSEAVLPSEEDQRTLFAEAASANLREAASAGIAFARGELGSTKGKAPAPDDSAVAKVAAALASTVVTLLRRRLSGNEAAAGVDGATERVGAAYREWRGERIERLVGDYAVEAFSIGVRTTAGGAGLRWVLAGGGAGCADCDDNALAGVVGPGEEFPTGHHHPPAHAGCRCLVVPTPA